MAKKSEVQKTEKTLFGLVNDSLSAVDKMAMAMAVNSIQHGKKEKAVKLSKDELHNLAMDIVANFPAKADLCSYLTATSKSYLDQNIFGYGDAKVSENSAKTIVTANRERFARFFHRAYAALNPLGKFEIFGTANFQFRLKKMDQEKSSREKFIDAGLDAGLDIQAISQIKDVFDLNAIRLVAVSIERDRSTLEKKKAEKARTDIQVVDNAVKNLLSCDAFAGFTADQVAKALKGIEKTAVVK